MLILWMLPLITYVSSGTFSPNSDVFVMDATTFENTIRGDQITVVLFFQEGCDHCKKFANTFEKFCRIMDGVVKTGIIDIDQYKFLGSYYNIKGVPAVKIFSQNLRSVVFNKDREVKSLIHATFDVIKTELLFRYRKFSPRLDETLNYTEINVAKMDDVIRYSKKMWVVMLYTKYCSACEKLTTKWHQIHGIYKDQVKFGILDGANSYGFLRSNQVFGYPLLRFYYNQSLFTNYDGDLYLDELSQWVNSSIHNQTGLTYQPQSIKKLCELSPSCVLTILPDHETCSQTCQNKLFGVLHGGINKFKNMDWSWAWFILGTEVDLDVKFLTSIAEDIPATFFIDPGNSTIKKLPYTFDEIGLRDFLTTLNTTVNEEDEYELPISFWKTKDGIF